MRELVRQVEMIKTSPDDQIWRGLAADFAKIKRSSYTLPISREPAIEHGLVEPTSEEAAKIERDHAESERRAVERKIRMDAARAQLAAITEEPARTILDLHREDQSHGWSACAGCEYGGYEGEPPDWPCTTVVTTAKHYGIGIPD